MSGPGGGHLECIVMDLERNRTRGGMSGPGKNNLECLVYKRNRTRGGMSVDREGSDLCGENMHRQIT